MKMITRTTFGLSLTRFGLLSLVLGTLWGCQHTLATAPLAIPRGGVMECTLANLHDRSVQFTIRQYQHFRSSPALPNDGFVVEKTETLGPGQSSALAATVGSDPAIGRCTFAFEGTKTNVRGAAVILQDVSGTQESDFIYKLQDGKAAAAVSAK